MIVYILGILYVVGALAMAKFLHWMNDRLNKTTDGVRGEASEMKDEMKESKLEISQLREETKGLRSDTRELIEVLHQSNRHMSSVDDGIDAMKGTLQTVVDGVPILRKVDGGSTESVTSDSFLDGLFDDDGDDGEWGFLGGVVSTVEKEAAKAISDTVMEGLGNLRNNMKRAREERVTREESRPRPPAPKEEPPKEPAPLPPKNDPSVS